MPQTAKHYSLSEQDKKSLHALVDEFCAASDKTRTSKIIDAIKQHFSDFSQANGKHKQAIGFWVCNFLLDLIPQLGQHRQEAHCHKADLITYLMNVPCEANAESYSAIFKAVKDKEIAPLTKNRYLFLLEMVFLLIELGSDKAAKYLSELSVILDNKAKPSLYKLLVKMLITRAGASSDKELDEQLNWLDLILSSWTNLDRCTTEYFMIQWVVSLHWLRPNALRKELLALLLETCNNSDDQNKSIILFELFDLPDKTVTTGEKLTYLSKLQALPLELFKVSQLQSIYYFSGSLKSTLAASFMESVADFQNSNYYIHKYWGWIGMINQFFLKHFSAADYMEIQKNIEQITKELINLINIQSNAYVETLQSNYDKINDLYHQVEELSLRDTLTGLHNRRFLYNNINELLQLAVRQQSPLSFVIIDIDDFKPINDTYGHLTGDFILSEMSQMLRNYFRKSDFVIRYGGEEFLIVMFNSDHIQTEQALDNLRKNMMNKAFRYEESELHLTISIGIASCVFETPYSAVHLEKLIAEADSAMYDSKARGKNKITSKVIYY